MPRTKHIIQKKSHRKTFRHKPGCKAPRLQPMNCSPIVNGKTVKEGSCLTPEILLKIKNAYNESHPNDVIVSKDPREIWQTLHDRLTTCEKEDCWLKEIKSEEMQKQIKQHIFAPKQPADWKDNPSEWLSNYDIFNVARQYEETYPHFKFLGPTMIDFDARPKDMAGKCVEEDLCNFELNRYLKKGKNKIGIVFNLDTHDKNGSHWVSMFIDVPNRFIFFFDSAGGGIPKEVKVLIQRIQKQSSAKLRLYTNGRFQHQYGNNECGMYSLFFIITMLTEKTEFTGKLATKDRIQLFLKKRIPDKVMFDYRDFYFNP